MPPPPRSLPTPREQLAAELRALRLQAGLTTTDLAEQLGISQAKVSRVERCRVAAQPADTRAWAAACGADPDTADRLAAAAEAALVERRAWRTAEPGGLTGQQHDVGVLEATAGRIDTLTFGLVPGLLQTAEYARRVFAALRDEPGEVATAVAARQARQAVLYDERKRIEFVVGEAALRWTPGPAEGAATAALAQIRHVESAATLPNVHLHLLPFGALPDLPLHGFTLYADRGEDPDVVAVETWTAGLELSRPAETATYRGVLDRFRAASLHDDDALDALRRISTDLRQDANRP